MGFCQEEVVAQEAGVGLEAAPQELEGQGMAVILMVIIVTDLCQYKYGISGTR